MTTVAENVIWNLFLRQRPGDSYEIVMPNEDGVFSPLPTAATDDGILVRWPVNPHSTGERMIIQMLLMTEKFANSVFSFESRD
jgi:hypothetical protein